LLADIRRRKISDKTIKIYQNISKIFRRRNGLRTSFAKENSILLIFKKNLKKKKNKIGT